MILTVQWEMEIAYHCVSELQEKVSTFIVFPLCLRAD